ncbi:acyl-CoA dehydrogenase family protein [Corynebacterium sp. 153RC1]|uniref:acyl-CoA dehydrogenase family protein n=1 Tax=unclassified Corynebacterium TaxID=2624378 RepID=UPI00211C0D03|nr:MULTISPECIES: acyl-CoA dehydrogenase family protein [unclassified Corynebacterium]MCQ9370479.1 acyl-CoA dehydrogenase family protein [Corynebacterium sp. 35RC1]MCQ9352717.1 acyl-CoA dehydrogenase family protein [Corynebacterium sp. 209RC1]MCQ9354901.1 acyl-CoA dehydrogenase family protein [Corynebacterium sp. 1222RC1]MCQ9357086.1 acyl-CoA dehydrogenase family protein [Corynebacterium sp. 122RC1]MCQ9359332.1 acyl-CoA dehydrogenase family protein [Corynebacterium sp. 142RC1]
MAAGNTDLIGIEALLQPSEIETRNRVRALVDEHIKPHVGQWFENAELPTHLFPILAEAGLFGMHIKGYGCAGKSAVEYGLAMQELEAGDSGIRTVVSVQGSLAMSAIYKHGSEEQKEHWLPRMAKGEVIGCFALTEPTAGSDPSSMATHAQWVDGQWRLSGAKRWIGLASVAQVAIVWAKVSDADVVASGNTLEKESAGGATVRGFIVPTDLEGFTATPITNKLSMRASIQCDIEMDQVALPADALLPKNPGLKAPFMCLNEARFGIAFGAMGAARDALECALEYSAERLQFERPLSSFQLTQQKLANMAVELNKGQLLALTIGRAKDAGTLQTHQISVGKLSNCRTAIEICQLARTILGGNGITTEYSPMRHAANLESVRTYEGTDEVHTLILGQVLTGENAFR